MFNISEPSILHEDDSLIFVNKPSGWITNKASTTKDQPVLQTWLEDNLIYDIAKNNEYRSGIVHRLDKPTSGVLVIAKDIDTFKKLQSEFKNRNVKKTYIALSHGRIGPKTGVIDAPVGRLPWRRDRFGVLAGGRMAKTGYTSLELYKNDQEEFTLVELKPVTGRTHQIRIHLKYLGNPIVSDTFYAGRKTARRDLEWCPRLFLHASILEIQHPKNLTKLKIKAPLTNELKKVLNSLELIE